MHFKYFFLVSLSLQYSFNAMKYDSFFKKEKPIYMQECDPLSFY